MTTLTDMFQHQLGRARRTGIWEVIGLKGGAFVWVKVNDGMLRVIFGRGAKQLGERELRTFVQHCAIPDAAERIPADLKEQLTKDTPAGPMWYVEYRWKEAS